MIEVCCESAEEDEKGLDAELNLDTAKTKLSSVPARFEFRGKEKII